MVISLILAAQAVGLSLTLGPVTVDELLRTVNKQVGSKLEAYGELRDIEVVTAFTDRPLSEFQSALAALLDGAWAGNVLYRPQIVSDAYQAQSQRTTSEDRELPETFFDWIENKGTIEDAAVFSPYLGEFLTEYPEFANGLVKMNEEDFVRLKNGYVTPLFEADKLIALITVNNPGRVAYFRFFDPDEYYQYRTVALAEIEARISPLELPDWSYTGDWTMVDFQMGLDYPALTKPVVESRGVRFRNSVHHAAVKLDKPALGYFVPENFRGNWSEVMSNYHSYKERDGWMLFRPAYYYRTASYSRHRAAVGNSVRLKDSLLALDLAAQFTLEHKRRFDDDYIRSKLWPRRLLVQKLPKYSAKFWQQLPAEQKKRLMDEGLFVDDVPYGMSQQFSDLVLTIVADGSHDDEGKPLRPDLRADEVRGLRLTISPQYDALYLFNFRGGSEFTKTWERARNFKGDIDVAFIDDHRFTFSVTTPRAITFNSMAYVTFVVGSAKLEEMKDIPVEEHEAWFAARAKGD